MKKLVTFFIFLLVGGFVGWRYFFYVDFSADCYLRLQPSLLELSAGNIKQAIRILKHAAPAEYAKLCRHVDVINPNLSCGGFGGGCYYARDLGQDRQIDISTAHSNFLGLTAAIIVHETCHAIQHQQGRSLSEAECYELDNEVLKNLVVY